MNKRISITGINYEIKPLQEGEAQIFDGAGKIIVSAIKCLQENRFRVYAVCMDQVFDKTCFDYLQRFTTITAELFKGRVKK